MKHQSAFLMHSVPAKRRGFTLVELLVVIAILVVLAALLLPALARARDRALTAACLCNLKQLDSCWHLYTMDNSDLLTPNNSIYGINVNSQFIAGASWCLGDARYDTMPTNIENGLLYSYNGSVALYHCPADRSTILDANGNPLPQLRNRSYNMSQSVNGYPEFNSELVQLIPAFKRFTQIQAPSPASCMVFIDELADTMMDAEFGMPTEFYDGSNNWWDMPANRHGRGANLSFADGHVEHWKWFVPKVFADWIQPALPAEMADYNRVRGALRQYPN